jgi:hypothetical protein
MEAVLRYLDAIEQITAQSGRSTATVQRPPAFRNCLSPGRSSHDAEMLLSVAHELPWRKARSRSRKLQTFTLGSGV